MNDIVSRQWLLDEYDRRHEGPPGGARKIIEEAPAATLCGYSLDYLLIIAKLMASANVTPEVMVSTIKDVEEMARMVIEMARKQVEEAIIKVIINGEGVSE